MDEAGKLLPPGELGEVVIRGRNVTAGYENNPEANAAAFTNGWFRTGDQGVLDEDGYLRLTGRLKEIINRGGEKITPLEVDEVLMDHPAVAQCLTFAHAARQAGRGGRRGGRAARGQSVPKDTSCATSAPTRLAAFKVPRKIVFLDRDPEGRHRQAAAHRPGREARPVAHEGSRSSAPARSAACSASSWRRPART